MLVREDADTYVFYGTVGDPLPGAKSTHNLPELLAECFAGKFVRITIDVPKDTAEGFRCLQRFDAKV